MKANMNVRYDRQFDADCRYDGYDLGCRCAGGRTVFRLWSPQARRVELSLYRDGQSGAERVSRAF